MDAVAAAIVDVARRVILPRFGSLADDEIEAKKPGDLVTIADREAEIELTAFLHAEDPDSLVVGEEATFSDRSLVGRLPEARHAWLVDPVDGTNNFAHGRPEFGVIVAELRDGRTVNGWIWQPIAGRMFRATRGGGVLDEGVELPTLSPPGKDGVARVCVPKFLLKRGAPGIELLPTARACAVDYPRLITGEVDALVYTVQHPWDHAAGVLAAEELGGYAALDDGTRWRPGLRGSLLIVAASEDVWQRTRSALLG